MDLYTRQHFAAWLKNTVPAGDKVETRRRILALLNQDPGLLEGRSWPELRALAENAGIIG